VASRHLNDSALVGSGRRTRAGRRTLAPFVFVALVLSLRPSQVEASPPRARLVFIKTAGTSHCPEQAAFEAQVAARLPEMPFVSYSETLMIAVLEAVGAEHRGTLYLRDGADHATAPRVVRERSCSEVVASLAVIASVALQPAPPADGQPTAAPPDDVPSPSPVEPPPPPANPALTASSPAEPMVASVVSMSDRPAPSRRIELALGPDTSVWRRVGFGPSLAASVGIAGPGRSVALELRGAWPDRFGHTVGRIDVTPALIGVLPCLRWGGVGLCASVTGGVLVGRGRGYAESHTRLLPYAAAGVRTSYDLPIARLKVRPRLSAEAPFVRPTFEVESWRVWQTPIVALAAGLDLVLELP
jgi:hypothetical protein